MPCWPVACWLVARCTGAPVAWQSWTWSSLLLPASLQLHDQQHSPLSHSASKQIMFYYYQSIKSLQTCAQPLQLSLERPLYCIEQKVLISSEQFHWANIFLHGTASVRQYRFIAAPPTRLAPVRFNVPRLVDNCLSVHLRAGNVSRQSYLQ